MAIIYRLSLFHLLYGICLFTVTESDVRYVYSYDFTFTITLITAINNVKAIQISEYVNKNW